MKQRILSFVLAVCMIAVAIPVIALPAVAASREGFTTSMEVGGPNWPVAVTDDGTNYYPEYHGGWTVGKYEYGKYYEFDEVKKEGAKPIYLTYRGLMWGSSGPFLYMSDQPPLIYTFRNFYNRHLIGQINDYKLMIAMYTDEEPELADGRDITMWQYTSHGRIVGVRGNVDKSRFMGNHGLRDIKFNHVRRLEKQVSFFDVRKRMSK